MNVYPYRDAASRDRARGCMAGQLAGDSLGSLVEFMDPAQISLYYPYGGVRDMEDGGVWDNIEGQLTDDSEMALALTRAILRNSEYDPQKAREAYVRWFRSGPFDCGDTIRAALSGAGRDFDSQANGAMMRISPLAIFGASYSDDCVEAWARADAEITHPNPVCVQANALYAAAISRAIRTGCGAGELYESIRNRAEEMGADASLIAAVRAAENAPPSDFATWKAGWVLVAFQNALWQLLHTEDVEDALADTISRGGDTDTNAAICGALLGAVHGLSAIPWRWVESLRYCRPEGEDITHPRPPEYWPTYFIELADGLLAAREHRLAPAKPPPEKPIEHCYWVIPGKILAGEYPRDLDDESSAEKMRALTEAGVAAFIDLTAPGDTLFPYDEWLGDAERRSFPIDDMDIPQSPEQTAAILDLIDDNMENGKTTYIHCWGGIGRTGVIVGCWLARHGRGGQAALDELSRLWADNPKSAWTPSPQTPEQCDYVTNWKGMDAT